MWKKRSFMKNAVLDPFLTKFPATRALFESIQILPSKQSLYIPRIQTPYIKIDCQNGTVLIGIGK